jgi:hypothetical protein
LHISAIAKSLHDLFKQINLLYKEESAECNFSICSLCVKYPGAALPEMFSSRGQAEIGNGTIGLQEVISALGIDSAWITGCFETIHSGEHLLSSSWRYHEERPFYTGGAEDSSAPIALRIRVAVCWMCSKLSDSSLASPS